MPPTTLVRWEALTVVDRSTLKGQQVIPPSLANHAISIVLIIVLPITVVLGLIEWFTLVDHKLSPIMALAFGVGMAAFIAAIAVFMLLAFTNLGISLDDLGIHVFERSLARHKAIRRDYAWNDLGKATVVGLARGGDVGIDNPDWPLWLDRKQARVVLEDARYPFRGQLPPEVAIAIRPR